MHYTYDWDYVISLLTIKEIWLLLGGSLGIILYTGIKLYKRINEDKFKFKHWVLVIASSFLVLFLCSIFEQIIADFNSNTIDVSTTLVLAIYTAVKKFFEIMVLGAILSIVATSFSKEKNMNVDAILSQV